MLLALDITIRSQFFLLKLNDIDMDDMCFQQDVVRCHTARKTIKLLHETFPGRVTFSFWRSEVVPRFCDLAFLIFYLWCYLKSKIYANKPTISRALKDNIQLVSTTFIQIGL